MRRATALVALVLAVLWLPVTMHCALEGLPGLEFLICCAHEDAVPHEDDDCQADACAVVESGFYKLQDDDALVLGSRDVDVFDCKAQDQATVFTASQPPPDLAVGWQFFSRAAPLPRAPSCVL